MIFEHQYFVFLYFVFCILYFCVFLYRKLILYFVFWNIRFNIFYYVLLNSFVFHVWVLGFGVSLKFYELMIFEKLAQPRNLTRTATEEFGRIHYNVSHILEENNRLVFST